MQDRQKFEPYFLWVKKYWSSRGKPLDFKRHRYLQQIYEDQSPEIVFKKSAQAGITERLLTESIWLPDQFRETALYLFPTAGTISDLVQERLDDPINHSPYLSRISGRAKKIMGKQADKVGMKRFSRGFAYFRGSNTPTQITSVPADIVLVDELDRMEQENVPYFKQRMKHSSRKWIRWASTPTVPNFGIDAKYNESDQHECWIICNCGEKQKLTFEDNIDQEKLQLVCRKCRIQIKPWELKMEWIPANPGAKIRGYYICQLYSPLLDVAELVEESKKTSEWEVMQFYNQSLGLAYEPKGAKITEEDMQAAKREYVIPLKVKECFMGVDVGRMLHIVIKQKDKVVYIGEVKNFEDLDSLMNDYDVRKCVIDALPETRKAQEFANRFNGRVHLCYYTGLKEVKEGEWFKTEPQKVNTDRTISLDISNNELKKQVLHLPKNLEDYPDFKQHMKNLVRIVKEEKTGNKKAEYIRIGDDHYRHSLNYAVLAVHIFGKVVIPDVFTV